MPDEYEPIVLVFSTSGKTVTLSPALTKRFWEMIRRDKPEDPKAYLLQLIEDALAALEARPSPAT